MNWVSQQDYCVSKYPSSPQQHVTRLSSVVNFPYPLFQDVKQRDEEHDDEVTSQLSESFAQMEGADEAQNDQEEEQSDNSSSASNTGMWKSSSHEIQDTTVKDDPDYSTAVYQLNRKRT